MTLRQRMIISLVVFGLAIVLTLSFIQYNRATTVVDAISRGDYRRAVALLDTPETTGSAVRLLMLGNLYYTGLGVSQDFSRAAELYQEAAMLGNASAQYNLGLIYHNGLGIPTDKVTAAAWFLLADSGGISAADAYLRTLSGSMNPNKIQQAHRLKDSLATSITE